jgi:hypothetical protein
LLRDPDDIILNLKFINCKEFALIRFLGVFAKFRKSTVTTSCPTMCPYGAPRLSLDGFLLNFIYEYFSLRKFEKIQGSLKYVKNNG